VDVFYVTNEAGGKIRDEEVRERLSSAMLKALYRMDGKGGEREPETNQTGKQDGSR
jgi:hypothetical protein